MWGFAPERYPVVGFNTRGARDKFLAEAKPGDFLVMAGTRTAPTPEDQRGKLLGICRMGRREVDVLAILQEVGFETKPEDYKDGEYRWPYGLPILEAWRFAPFADLTVLDGTYLKGTHWAAYALNIEEKLDIDAVDRLEALALEPCEIIEVPSLAPIVALERNLARRRGLSGPPPSARRSGSEREMGTGWAYAFMLQGGTPDAVKIGFTSDVDRRLKTLNSGMFTAVTGCCWKRWMVQPFVDEPEAYRFEQEVLRLLRSHLIEGEEEVVVAREGVVKQAWVQAMCSANWDLEKNGS